MRLSIARSSRRVIDEKRYEQLLAGPKLSPEERRRRALAARQPDPPGIHCSTCGAVKPSFEAPCPNDGPDWPHPPASVTTESAAAVVNCRKCPHAAHDGRVCGVLGSTGIFCYCGARPTVSS